MPEMLQLLRRLVGELRVQTRELARPKALFYLEGTSDGGSEAVIGRIATAWRTAGYEALLASCGDGPSPLGIRWSRHEGRYLHTSAKTSPSARSTAPVSRKFSAWWRAVLDRERPQVVLANNGGYPWNLSCLQAIREAREAGVPRVVMAIHSTPEPGGHLEDERQSDAEVARACHAIVLGSPELALIVARERPALAGNLHVIRYGVPDPGPTLRQESHGHLPVRLGFASEMRGHRKGQLVLLDALQQLDLPSGSWEGRIAGDGCYLDFLRRRIDETALPVRLLGRLSPSEMNGFYRNIDIYVLPSLQEGLSLTVLESMAHGLPVVATDVGGHRDAILDSDTGYLVPAGDAIMLASVLAALCRNPHACLTMGRKGRRRYDELFTLEAYLDAWLELLSGEAN